MDANPSGTFYLDASFCDYKTIQAMDGREFDVVLFTKDGKQLGTKQADGTYRGAKAVIYTRFDLPESDNIQNSYPVYIMFRDVQDFKDMYMFAPTYKFADLLSYVAVGLELKLGTYSSGDITANVYERCTTTGKTGLVLADFEVLESNASDVAVTAISEVGLGEYTLTVKKDSSGTPANLESGEWAKIQASDDDATYVTYISQVAKFTV